MDDQQTNQQTGNTNQPGGPNDTLPPLEQPAEDNAQAATAAPSAAPPLMPPPGDMGSQQTVPDSRALVEVPDGAADSDLIEKEWVLKAKQIVDHTSEDPFLQQEELSKIKADYLKKRYNRDLGTV